MGHRVVSVVTVGIAWADCGVVAETIEDLATQEALSPGPGRGCGSGVAGLFE